MKIYLQPPVELWPSICKRPLFERDEIEFKVRTIMERVKVDGDKALLEYSEKYDHAHVQNLRVTGEEIYQASSSVPPDLKEAISIAIGNIEKFHRSHLSDEPSIETTAGVRCWRKNVPIERVGLYIPGGSAPLFSTVLMLGIPANIAGCGRIILCTPPGKNGSVNPLILYAAGQAGITDIYKAGGAQAIAAMAYGTETIPAVDKIFGPGNQYVTKAKELIQLDGIPIDMPAGPSEVLIIADRTADPSFVAADLLSQAEHGIDSQVVLVTTDGELIKKVNDEIEIQLSMLPRKDIASKAMGNSFAVQFESPDTCVEFSNQYAPEHLIICTSEPYVCAGRVRNAGSVFLGKYSCESAGDYATGTNHTLPTNGFAKNFSSVSVESFVKKITFQDVSPEGLKILGKTIEKMAEAELLSGHKNAVTLRLNSLKND
jgi:histidinol dehydrogenase